MPAHQIASTLGIDDPLMLDEHTVLLPTDGFRRVTAGSRGRWPGTACRARASHVLSKWKVHDRGASMRDVARDPAALEPLERLRVQRGRLADRIRPPWWFLTGVAIMWALVFAFPFTSRFLGVSVWPVFAAALAVACLLQWGLTRATGIKVGLNLRYPASGRPARIAVLVVCLAALGTEHFLIDRGLLAAAIVVAALAVAAEVAAQQAALRGIRQELRGGGGAA
jgi:hypothetical protein